MIDWDRLAELRDEVGAEDFEEVRAMFFDEISESIERLAACDVPEYLRNELHFLKGSALNLGLSELAGICTGYEDSLAKDETTRPDSEKLDQSFANARNALDAHAW